MVPHHRAAQGHRVRISFFYLLFSSLLFSILFPPQNPLTHRVRAHINRPVLDNPYRPLGPWYVAAKDPQQNRLYVTNSPETLGSGDGEESGDVDVARCVLVCMRVILGGGWGCVSVCAARGAGRRRETCSIDGPTKNTFIYTHYPLHKAAPSAWTASRGSQATRPLPFSPLTAAPPALLPAWKSRSGTAPTPTPTPLYRRATMPARVWRWCWEGRIVWPPGNMQHFTGRGASVWGRA